MRFECKEVYDYIIVFNSLNPNTVIRGGRGCLIMRLDSFWTVCVTCIYYLWPEGGGFLVGEGQGLGRGGRGRQLG